MSIHPATLSESNVTSDHFSLSIKHNKKITSINMTLLTPIVNTKYLPDTLHTLKKTLPSILRSQCFNEEELPFSKEVTRTEIGHLFEHIMLEYLCLLKLSRGYHSASFSGETTWNWKKDARGTFHITINIDHKDVIFFSEALEKTVQLMKVILPHGQHAQLYTKNTFAMASEPS